MRFFRNRFAITECIASNFDYRTRENEIGQRSFGEKRKMLYFCSMFHEPYVWLELVRE